MTDLAVLYPIESLWVAHKPARIGSSSSPRSQEIAGVYSQLSHALFASRRDFTYVDSQALREAVVSKGFLAHGVMKWRCVILPMADTLPMGAWQKLHRFWQEGGVVIAAGARPANSEGRFPDPRVQALADEMFGDGNAPVVKSSVAGGAAVYLPRGTEALLPFVLDGLFAPDVAVAPGEASVRYTHRRIDDHDVYFLINDSGRPQQVSVSLCAEGPGEVWDPATGEMKQVEGPSDIEVKFEPYGGVLLRFARASLPERHVLSSGPLPGLETEPLPEVQPRVGKGEFVEGEVKPDRDALGGGRPAWRAKGVLTKGDVDTFLFLGFNYDRPLDFSGALGLMFDTWAPEGQRTEARMFVILDEPGGAQYIAKLSRSLARSGVTRTFVPFSAFDLAGWAQDANGHLDLSAIKGVAVGWGGYYGTKGEKIEFAVALPEVVRGTR
ncbi:MAG: hypothetical protein J7M26_07420 [Armatimonadetes bacterium]|nr:hypothetical protein [Armatimonadota bacterium]